MIKILCGTSRRQSDRSSALWTTNSFAMQRVACQAYPIRRCTVFFNIYCSTFFTIFGKNVPRGYVSDPIQWRPREWNCAADLLANVGLQSPHELVHMDMSRVREACFLQCHSDGGFIPADGTGSWGFTVCIWQHTEQLGWTRDLVGYGHGRFEGCKHSLHAELVALDRLLQTLRPFVV